MRFILLLLLTLPFVGFIVHPAAEPGDEVKVPNPLSNYSPEWNKPVYGACNTAANVSYMTAEEKKLIWILNMMRKNPTLFLNSVVKPWPDSSGKGYLRYSNDYYTSLLETMRKQKALPMLKPDSLCFNGAKCHAISSGQAGYVGHDRLNAACRAEWYYNGECCDYGNSSALFILMNLMVDEGVPSLGHRDICLTAYTKIGVSIQPHKRYGVNTVLDFHY